MIDAVRYQLLYEQLRTWLDGHGIAASVLLSENFSVSWTLRTLQTIGSRLNNTFSFWIVALVYVLLGLAETEEFGARIRQLKDQAAATAFLRASRSAAAKIRFYMVLRALMSIATGSFVWLLTWLVGLPFAETWGGFVAFILNFIPFLGPLVATLLITAFAFTHFANWQMALMVFIGLNIVQSVIGSVIEPRLTGKDDFPVPLRNALFRFRMGGFPVGGRLRSVHRRTDHYRCPDFLRAILRHELVCGNIRLFSRAALKVVG
ncbi:hypothetical protein Q644_24720 [Brucella intermedia 229E]|uniref:AI-2E family transporter n=1 Tax=Brucella intermedia 229E TaxID=1337887 RepID=U4VDH5_9HYPH|nr:hypothetical protein Q644_24720 [Brucella intermedia 229E]